MTQYRSLFFHSSSGNTTSTSRTAHLCDWEMCANQCGQWRGKKAFPAHSVEETYNLVKASSKSGSEIMFEIAGCQPIFCFWGNKQMYCCVLCTLVCTQIPNKTTFSPRATQFLGSFIFFTMNNVFRNVKFDLCKKSFSVYPLCVTQCLLYLCL